MFLSNERAGCIYKIVSRFMALTYKPKKYIYLIKRTSQVFSIRYMLFILFILFLLIIAYVSIIIFDHTSRDFRQS